MREVLNKILNPNKVIGFLLFNVCTVLMIYVFSCHLEDTPLAYFTYLYSTYCLIIFCIWFFKICQFSNDFIKNTYLFELYKKYELNITRITLLFSTLLHFVYGIFKLSTGIYYMSWWFITFAIYYLLLCFMKLSIVKNIKNKVGIDLKNEYKKLKSTGILLLFLNLILSSMITLIIHQNKEITYAGFIIYIVAIYDFYLIISAIINVLKYRKDHSPLLASSKCINLTVAMISMLSLAVAMISQFGDNNSQFKIIMISCMGFLICLINSLMSINMIIRANKKLKCK